MLGEYFDKSLITFVKYVSIIGPDKQKFQGLLRIFSYPLVKTYVVGAQKNRLNETVLLSTQNICVG